MRMLPLMSTRIARLRGDWRSDRNERIARSSPLSRISKSFDVNPDTTRPRPSRTDACIVTTSTALRKTCRLCEASCALAKEAAVPTNAAAQATDFKIDLMIPTQNCFGEGAIVSPATIETNARDVSDIGYRGRFVYRREVVTARSRRAGQKTKARLLGRAFPLCALDELGVCHWSDAWIRTGTPAPSRFCRVFQ